MDKAILDYRELVRSEDFNVDGMVSPTFYNVGDGTAAVNLVPVNPGNFIRLDSNGLPRTGSVKVKFEDEAAKNRLVIHYDTIVASDCGCKNN